MSTKWNFLPGTKRCADRTAQEEVDATEAAALSRSKAAYSATAVLALAMVRAGLQPFAVSMVLGAHRSQLSCREPGGRQ